MPIPQKNSYTEDDYYALPLLQSS